MNPNWTKVNSELYKNKAGGVLKKYPDGWRYIDSDNFNIQIPLRDIFENPEFGVSDIVSKQTIQTFEFELIENQTSVTITGDYSLSNAILYLEGIQLSKNLYNIDKYTNTISFNFTPNDGELIICVCY